MRLALRLPRTWFVVLSLGVVSTVMVAFFALSFHSAPASAADTCQTFNETGFTVCGRFLEYWKANGGLAQQGFPISKVFDEQNAPPPAGDGKIHRVQYFQRARFEEHLENAAPYDVLLGLLGTEQYQSKYASGSPSFIGDLTGTSCQTFAETGFKACGRFLEYWKANGGLAQQGFPISGEFEEVNAPPPAGDGKTHRVQYFQRARFEAHSENVPPYDVLLGLLGSEQYTKKYAGGTPSATPTIPTTGRVILASVQGAAPGQIANVIAQTGANAFCSIVYITPSGQGSSGPGLENKNANNSGIVYWSWRISPDTKPGIGSITVTCNGVSASRAITIG